MISRPCLSLLPLHVLLQPPPTSLGSGTMLAAPCVMICNRYCSSSSRKASRLTPTALFATVSVTPTLEVRFSGCP
jgi:hypothetical protein